MRIVQLVTVPGLAFIAGAVTMRYQKSGRPVWHL